LNEKTTKRRMIKSENDGRVYSLGDKEREEKTDDRVLNKGKGGGRRKHQLGHRVFNPNPPDWGAKKQNGMGGATLFVRKEKDYAECCGELTVLAA